MVRYSDGRLQSWRCTVSVCGGSALLVDLFGVSRSLIARDFLSIVDMIFSSVLFVSSLALMYSYYMFVRVRCFDLVVSTCQLIG